MAKGYKNPDEIPINRITCPYCKFLVHIRYLDQHTAKCANVPSGKALSEMLDADETLSMNNLRNLYRINEKYIHIRLKGTKWTKEALRKRGKEAAWRKSQIAKLKNRKKKKWSSETVERLKLAKCICGILLDDGQKKCRFCQEESAGIIDYKVKYGIR